MTVGAYAADGSLNVTIAGGSVGTTIGSAVSGGTNSTLLYVDSGGLLQNSATIPFTPTFAAGTITTSQPLTLTQTLNGAGVNFTALLLGLTNTASNSITFIDFKVGGSSRGSISNGGSGAAFSGAALQGVELNTYNSVAAAIAGTSTQRTVRIATTAIVVASGVSIGFSSSSGSGSDGGNSADTILQRDAANTLALRNGAVNQYGRIYGTWTDASNGEWLEFGHGSNAPYIWSTKNGSGTIRSLSFGAGGVSQWRIDTSGNWIAVTDNAYDIGASGATRPRNVYVAGTAFIGSGGFSNGGVNIGNLVQMLPGTTGILSLQNGAGGDFSRLQFGGTTSSFPALKRSAAILVSRLADDSADAAFQAATFNVGNYTVGGLPAAGTAGRIAFVTDQLTAVAAKGVAPTGGGSVKCMVVDTGAAWVGI